LVRLFLKQKPEVIKENSSIFRKIARLTPIGNVVTAGDYLKSHGLDQFEGKGKLSKLNEALNKKKVMEKKLFDDRVELQSLQLNFGFIDPEDDVEREIAREEIQSIQTGIERLNSQLQRINRKIEFYYKEGINEPVNVRSSAKPLPGPSRLRNGRGLSSSVPVVGWKQRTKELFDEYMTSEEWRKLFIDNIGNTQRQKVKQRSINSSLFLDIEEELTAEGVNVPDRDELGRYVIALIKDWINSLNFEVQDPGLPEPNGTGKSRLTLHAVIIKKPYDLQEARAVARDIMKSKKDKFMRETSTSYRFRNIPKTKFSSFVTKVLNPQVSLVFGKLK
jgi:hypothetical protein